MIILQITHPSVIAVSTNDSCLPVDFVLGLPVLELSPSFTKMDVLSQKEFVHPFADDVFCRETGRTGAEGAL